jgi:PAS domain S-box-containing protein
MDARHQEIARCLFRESNDALFIFDPRDHRVLDVNPAAIRLTGFDKEIACAMRLRGLFTSGEPGGLDRLIEAYRRTGFCHSREGYFLAREAGEPIPVNISVSRIHTAPSPLGLVVARDISERLHAQEALRDSEVRYRGLVETAKVLIWAADSEGRIESMNPAFEDLIGRPHASMIGRHFAELIHPDDRPRAFESFAATLGGESVPPYELRVRGASGDDLVIEVLSAARQLRGDRMGVSGIARDVTERRRAERALGEAEAMRVAKEAAEAADRAKSEFLANVSHEIRTPMTAILGFTDVLLADPRMAALPPDLIENLGTIKQNGNHLLALINDILDLTKIEMGKLRIDRSPCSPARVVEDVAASMRPRAEAKGVSLVVEHLGELPATIRTDAVRLRQILINLLSNAIKFTNAGGIRVAMRSESGDGTDPTLEIAVIDTGVGMVESELAGLFEPFYTSETRTTRESGAGLGLAISRRLSQMLDGRISVRSLPGEGSTFTLRLPLDAETPAAPAPPPADRRVGAGSGTPQLGGRVLVAEDNEAIRRFLAIRLGHAGTEVAVACNGREAVDLALAALAADRPFDWILMDVQMPILDGYEATSQLRASGYPGPIIALTAYAIAGQREECLRFGCDDHVSKPVDWKVLMDVLATHRGKVREGESVGK